MFHDFIGKYATYLDKPKEESTRKEASEIMNNSHQCRNQTPKGHGCAYVDGWIGYFPNNNIRWNLHQDISSEENARGSLSL